MLRSWGTASTFGVNPVLFTGHTHIITAGFPLVLVSSFHLVLQSIFPCLALSVLWKTRPKSLLPCKRWRNRSKERTSMAEATKQASSTTRGTSSLSSSHSQCQLLLIPSRSVLQSTSHNNQEPPRSQHPPRFGCLHTGSASKQK